MIPAREAQRIGGINLMDAIMANLFESRFMGGFWIAVRLSRAQRFAPRFSRSVWLSAGPLWMVMMGGLVGVQGAQVQGEGAVPGESPSQEERAPISQHEAPSAASPSRVATPQPQVALETMMRGDAVTVRVSWTETDADSLLLLRIDSKAEVQARPQQETPGATGLFGIILGRRINKTGAESVDLQREKLAEAVGEGALVVTAYLATRVEIQLLAGDATIKGGLRVRETRSLEPKDLPFSWRLFCVGPDCAALRERVLLQPIELLDLKTPANDYFRVVIPGHAIRAAKDSTLEPKERYP